MLPRSLRSSGGLVTLLLLLISACFFVDRAADAAVVVARAKRRSSGSSSSLFSTSSSPPSRSIITSIARLRSVVSPSASNLPGCVLFLNATSATAAGCSSKPRRLRQDPPPTLPLVGGLPKGNDGKGRGLVISALGAGDDAVALDLLVKGGNSSELSSRGVAGLVALPGPPPEGDWSPDDANPQSEYCPYSIPANFSWVRGARGLLRAPLPVPVLAPYGEFAEAVAAATGVGTAKEKEKIPPPPLRLAVLDDSMEASRSGARNSSHCLSQGTCGPIGGYSVWAALPALPASGPASEGAGARGSFGDGDGPPPPAPTPPPPPPPNSSAVARTVVLAAAADSRQLLHGGSAGAGALSGLVALLAAAEALGNATRSAAAAAAAAKEENSILAALPPPPPFPGRVLFVALATEPWGFLGSRRLLWEARDRGGDGSTRESFSSSSSSSSFSLSGGTGGGRDDGACGFPLSEVSWLIELGAVGDSPRNGSSSNSTALLFAHPGTTAGSKEGPAAALLLGGSSSSSSSAAAVALPSSAAGVAAGGGPPPGSLWAWATASPNVSSALLSAHESSVGGAHSSSRWDDARRLDPRSVAAAAAVAARAAAAGAGASSEFLSLSPPPPPSISSYSSSNSSSSSSSSPPAPAPFLSAEAVLPRVLELISCLVAKEPGLGGGGGGGESGARSEACRLSLELLGARGAAEARAAALDGGGTPHHAGPLRTLTADPQAFEPLAKKPYTRFLWEFLAGATGEEAKEAARPCTREEGGGRSGGCPAGSVCARSSASSPSGTACVRASVAFVAAYPLNIECVSCDGADHYGNWQTLETEEEEEEEGKGENQALTSRERREMREQQPPPPPPPPLAAAAAADAWRRSLGWPEEALWAESDWDEGVPRLSLWQASPPAAASSSGGFGFGLLLLWAAAASASVGVLSVAAAAKRALEQTRRESYGYGGEEEGGSENDRGFVPSF